MIRFGALRSNKCPLPNKRPPSSHLKKVFANKRPYSNKHPSGVSTLIPIRALTPENASIPVSVPIFVSEMAL